MFPKTVSDSSIFLVYPQTVHVAYIVTLSMLISFVISCTVTLLLPGTFAFYDISIMVMIIRIYHECEGGIEKYILRITV